MLAAEHVWAKIGKTLPRRDRWVGVEYQYARAALG